jgi:hypothetical protein
MHSWLAAAALAACWPLMGSAGGAIAVRLLGLPSIFLAPLVLAAGSFASYVVLWAYFVDPVAGQAAWTFVLLVNGAWLAHQWWQSGWAWRGVERDAWVPFALTALVTICCLSYLSWAGVSPPRRFTIPLPVADHLVPQLFAERLARGIRREPRPLAPLTTFALTTRTSDRPPLQAGVALAARPAWPVSGGTLDTSYQTVATLCQVTVLPALLALAAALRLSRRETGFVMLGVACSGVFLANATYPWPKLYAAALLLTGLAVLVHVTTRSDANDAHSIAIGSLAGLALLAHGSPVFSLLAAPILLFQASVRRVATVRRVAVAVLAASILLAPWLAYQRYFDPPGTALVKIHLAGALVPDSRSLPAALLAAYRGTDLSEWWRNRIENARAQFFVDWRGDDPVAGVQTSQFFGPVAALDLLVVGLVAFAVHRREEEPGLTLRALVGYATGAWLLWMVVMFRAGSAGIIHGSYATLLLFMMCGAVGLSSWRLLGSTLLGLHVAGFAAAWLLPRAGVPVPTWSAGAAFMLAASTLASIGVCRTWLREDQDSGLRKARISSPRRM